MDRKFNPYEDKSIHTTQPDQVEEYAEREGFNDVMKHYDSVNGFQSPKQLNQIPQPVRPIFRWAIIIHLLLFFGFLMYQFFSNIVDISP